MKLTKTLLLLSSLTVLSGCRANQGAALTVENAKSYFKAFNENEGNANFNDKNVIFNIYPGDEKGKLFSPDIKGKCNITVKYLKGMTADLKFDWSDPVTVNGVEFKYKEGDTSESGFKMADSLEGVFEYNVDYSFSAVNVYNLEVTEISGHMLP